jgi:hypothetical protein
MWFAVAIVPLAAFAAFKSCPAHLLRRALAGCAAILVLGFLSSWGAHFQFLSKTADQVGAVVALFCWSFLACTPDLIKRPWVRWPVIAVCGAAVLISWSVVMASVAFGPDPVRKRATFASGEVCEVRLWGMAFTQSGYRVTIYKDWPRLGLRRELSSEWVDETRGDRDVTCQDLLARIGRSG